jgi:phosphoglycerate dehydrogenase-like enzyme
MVKVHVVTNVFTESSGWKLDEEYAAAIRAVSDRVTVTVAGTTSELLEALSSAEVVFGRAPTSEERRSATHLRWVQLASAGANNVLTPDFLQTEIILTTAAGVHPIQISEHVFAMMLMFARRMHEYRAAQAESRWTKEPVGRMDELFEKTLGIVGLGSIGREVARKAKAFGMHVVATRRHLDQTAAPDVDELLSREQLHQLLEVSDYVVLSVPLTKETRHLIGPRELRTMKPTAFLINIARGAVVDEAALCDALNEGTVAGAGLDTFDVEPLPEDSPLWRMPNVIITPHTAGTTPRYWERATHLFCENLARYLEGKPLRNVVSRELGY